MHSSSNALSLSEYLWRRNIWHRWTPLGTNYLLTEGFKAKREAYIFQSFCSKWLTNTFATILSGFTKAKHLILKWLQVLRYKRICSKLLEKERPEKSRTLQAGKCGIRKPLLVILSIIIDQFSTMKVSSFYFLHERGFREMVERREVDFKWK